MLYEMNQYYHIFNRGCNKEDIFRDEADYEKLLQYIKSSNHKDYLQLYAFSLMPNHYHFFLKQISDKPVYRWFQFIFNRYTQYFNNKYERKGTIFESSIKSKIITDEQYFGLIAHYIHSNPKNEFQKNYSSLRYLYDETMINQEFYFENFGSIEEYLSSFKEYSEFKNENEIEKYIFDK